MKSEMGMVSPTMKIAAIDLGRKLFDALKSLVRKRDPPRFQADHIKQCNKMETLK
jgi:hypothetical protein